jgi:prophage regulatory protein
MFENQHSSIKVLRLKGVMHKTGDGRSTIYNKNNPASKYYDPTYPKPIRLGAKSVGWIESEIDAWIESRAAARQVAKEAA